MAVCLSTLSASLGKSNVELLTRIPPYIYWLISDDERYHRVSRLCKVGMAPDTPKECSTVVLQKRAHGQYTLPWAQTGGWADIQAINTTKLSAQSGANSV